MKKVLLLILLAGIVALGYIVFTEKIVTQEQKIPTSAPIVISKQDPQKEIVIESVVMPASGWVVARAIDGNRLGQVIEISRFLTEGNHSQIIIPLGDFYNGEELIGMIYVDNGDAIFNDNDQPYKDAMGKMIAAFVKTGESVPMPMMQPEISGDHTMGGNMVTIKYTNSDFEPKNIIIKVGTAVSFINESDKEMWVASDDHPSHQTLPTFDQFKTKGKGGTYTYVFDKAGIWKYHDHINPEKEGVIEVR